MRKLILLTILLAGIAMAGHVVTSNMPSAEPLGPCPTEDSDNCYWDAPTMGDGTGESFVTINGTSYYEDGSTITWEE